MYNIHSNRHFPGENTDRQKLPFWLSAIDVITRDVWTVLQNNRKFTNMKKKKPMTNWILKQHPLILVKCASFPSNHKSTYAFKTVYFCKYKHKNLRIFYKILSIFYIINLKITHFLFYRLFFFKSTYFWHYSVIFL